MALDEACFSAPAESLSKGSALALAPYPGKYTWSVMEKVTEPHPKWIKLMCPLIFNVI